MIWKRIVQTLGAARYEKDSRLNIEVGNNANAHPASSSAGPEEVLILVVRVGVYDLPVEQNHFQTHQVVVGDAVLVGLECDASTEQEAADSNGSSTGTQECPSSALERREDVAGVITAANLQDRPRSAWAGRAHIGTGGELGLTKAVAEVWDVSCASLTSYLYCGGINDHSQINYDTGRLCPSKVCMSAAHCEHQGQHSHQLRR